MPLASLTSHWLNGWDDQPLPRPTTVVWSHPRVRRKRASGSAQIVGHLTISSVGQFVPLWLKEDEEVLLLLLAEQIL